jgi:transketolase
MKKYTNTGSKDTRSGFGAGMTELGQRMKMWYFVLI